MITLLGGKYDGRFLDRPKEDYKVGESIALIDDGFHEVYRVTAPGVAEVEDPYAKLTTASLIKVAEAF
jgi:hypothetical protein